MPRVSNAGSATMAGGGHPAPADSAADGGAADPPVKRGRGRPPLPPHMKKQQRAPTGLPRGRPKGSGGVQKPRVVKPPVPGAKPRGRPRKTDAKPSAAAGAAGRKPDLDPETAAMAAALKGASQTTAAVAPVPGKRGRGRPRKTEVVVPKKAPEPVYVQEEEEDDEDEDEDDDIADDEDVYPDPASFMALDDEGDEDADGAEDEDDD